MNAPRKRPHPDVAGLSPATRNELARARRAARWVGLILPLALILAATVLLVIWLPRMPDPAATHWGLSAAPDGFGPPSSSLWLTAGLGFAVLCLAWLAIARAGHGAAMPLWSGYQRLVAAFAAGFAAFAAVLGVGSAAVQLDLADAADARGIGTIMACSFASWLVVGLGGWFAQPRVIILQPEAPVSEPLRLTGTQRAVWIGRARASRMFVSVIGAAILLVAAGAVVGFLSPAAPALGWILVLVLVILLACAAISLDFHVRIDASGLEARSFIGWPVIRLPAAEVASVTATRIAATAEFGGWGLRLAPGRFGIITRAGEGLVATRRDGRLFAITIDDADRAAAALTASALAAAELAAAAALAAADVHREGGR